MKEITCWYRWMADEWKFNHLEDGHSNLQMPKPKSEKQRAWYNYKWRKEHCYMDESKHIYNENSDG